MFQFNSWCPQYVLPPARLLAYRHEKHTIKTTSTNGLPDDENMMFETRRGHLEVN